MKKQTIGFCDYKGNKMYHWITIEEGIFQPNYILTKYNICLESLHFQTKDFDNYGTGFHFRYVKNKDNYIILMVEVDKNYKPVMFEEEENEKLKEKIYIPFIYPNKTQFYAFPLIGNDKRCSIYINSFSNSTRGDVLFIEGSVEITDDGLSSNDFMILEESPLTPYDFEKQAEIFSTKGTFTK